MKLQDILNDKPVLIREYTDKTINSTIARWKELDPTVEDDLAKQVIQRFDQVKGGLSSKLNQIALSDELKQGNNYLNIDKYSWKDMVTLLRSLPEKDDKVKKDAIQLFMEKERIDKGIASSYVIRFMNNRRNLKYAMENGTEDEQFTKAEVLKFIPQRLVMSGQVLDPRAWNFSQLEHMLDALFPYYGKEGEDEAQNTATTDADKVYEQNGIEIYKGDAQHKCVSYNPTEGGRKKYGWCIAQTGNSNYDYYRFQQGTNRMFYICFDRNQPESNKWHAFVIHVGEGQKVYWATSAKNDGDNQSQTWEGLSKYIDPQTWDKIKGLKEVFKYIPPSKAEIASAALRGKKLSANDFRELDYDVKEQYIQSNAGSLAPEILQILDKELKNLAINYGQKFPYNDLKENEGLAKRYAVFRFRHTNYSKDPIPLPYVKYLDEEAKQKYLDTFDNNLTFEYINKFFGEQATQNYVQKQIDDLDFLPQAAIGYIQDPKKKKLFEVYSKLFDPWVFGDNTNMDEEGLSTSFDMPEQSVDPKPLSAKQWAGLNPEDRKIIINLAKSVNGKDKYSTILYALPYIVQDPKRGDLLLLPLTNNDYSYEKWVLVDENNNVVKKDIDGESSQVGEQPLILGFPNIEQDPRRVFPTSDVTLNGKQGINEIKVNNPSPQKRTLGQEAFSYNEAMKLHDLDQNILDYVIKKYGNQTQPRPGRATKLGKVLLQKIQRLAKKNNDDELKKLLSARNVARIKMGLNEIKVNDPILPTEEEYIKLVAEISEEDGVPYDILEKYIPEDIITDYYTGELEFWKYVKDNDKRALIDELQKYHDENIGNNNEIEESFEEQFIRERLMNRAGLI